MGHIEERVLEFEMAGLRQQLADLREQLVAEKAKVWALEERIRAGCTLNEECE